MLWFNVHFTPPSSWEVDVALEVEVDVRVRTSACCSFSSLFLRPPLTLFSKSNKKSKSLLFPPYTPSPHSFRFRSRCERSCPKPRWKPKPSLLANPALTPPPSDGELEVEVDMTVFVFQFDFMIHHLSPPCPRSSKPNPSLTPPLLFEVDVDVEVRVCSFSSMFASPLLLFSPLCWRSRSRIGSRNAPSPPLSGSRSRSQRSYVSFRLPFPLLSPSFLPLLPLSEADVGMRARASFSSMFTSWSLPSSDGEVAVELGIELFPRSRPLPKCDQCWRRPAK